MSDALNRLILIPTKGIQKEVRIYSNNFREKRLESNFFIYELISEKYLKKVKYKQTHLTREKYVF